MYDRYRVLKANITLTHTTKGEQSGMTFGVFVDSDATRATLSQRAIAENNSSRWRSVTTTGGSKGMGTVKMSIRPYRWLDTGYKEDAYSAFTTGTPVEECFFGTYALADSAIPQGPQQYNHKICIDYWVEFFSPKDISPP